MLYRMLLRDAWQNGISDSLQKYKRWLGMNFVLTSTSQSQSFGYSEGWTYVLLYFDKGQVVFFLLFQKSKMMRFISAICGTG